MGFTHSFIILLVTNMDRVIFMAIESFIVHLAHCFEWPKTANASKLIKCTANVTTLLLRALISLHTQSVACISCYKPTCNWHKYVHCNYMLAISSVIHAWSIILVTLWDRPVGIIQCIMHAYYNKNNIEDWQLDQKKYVNIVKAT